MMLVPSGVKVHLALGFTDLRKGLDGLAMQVQAFSLRMLSQVICSCFVGAGPI